MPKISEARPRSRYRLLFGGIALMAFFASSAWAAKTVQHYLFTDGRFELKQRATGFRGSGITVTGTKNAQPANVQQVFAHDFGHSIFEIPLRERRRRLLAIDWIEEASVSRIWPNRILVHVQERKPVAFVNIPHQAFLLIDAEGVLLAPPLRANFALPVLNGVYVDQTEPERRLRVQAALRMLDDLGAAAKDVSEVNAASPDDLRVIAEVQGKTVELWLGDANFGSRYGHFVDHWSDIRAGSPRANVFDLRIDDRITAR